MSPVIVGIGGSTSSSSVSNLLLQRCLEHATDLGAVTQAFDGAFLARLPIFAPDDAASPDALVLADAVRAADAVVIATPGYHGGMSGLIKNAIDHLEVLRSDARPYLDGRAVGIVVAASGWQACGTTLVSVRSAVHALRGWPTPLGVMVNSAVQKPDDAGRFEPLVDDALGLLARQLTDFVGWRTSARTGIVP